MVHGSDHVDDEGDDDDFDDDAGGVDEGGGDEHTDICACDSVQCNQNDCPYTTMTSNYGDEDQHHTPHFYTRGAWAGRGFHRMPWHTDWQFALQIFTLGVSAEIIRSTFLPNT